MSVDSLNVVTVIGRTIVLETIVDKHGIVYLLMGTFSNSYHNRIDEYAIKMVDHSNKCFYFDSHTYIDDAYTHFNNIRSTM